MDSQSSGKRSTFNHDVIEKWADGSDSDSSELYDVASVSTATSSNEGDYDDVSRRLKNMRSFKHANASYGGQSIDSADTDGSICEPSFHAYGYRDTTNSSGTRSKKLNAVETPLLVSKYTPHTATLKLLQQRTHN